MSRLDQAARSSGSRRRPAIDLQWFRKELEQERRFRLDQLTDLSYEAAGAADDVQAEVTAVLMTGARTVLSEIDAALFRLATGSFGVCQQCGRAIPVERLEAVPMAALCVTCKYAKESHRPAPDIVDVWGADSFPASDPPANW